VLGGRVLGWGVRCKEEPALGDTMKALPTLWCRRWGGSCCRISWRGGWGALWVRLLLHELWPGSQSGVALWMLERTVPQYCVQVLQDDSDCTT
jgi:hypothetical protein